MRLSGHFLISLFSFSTKRFWAYKKGNQPKQISKTTNKRTKNNKGNNFLHKKLQRGWKYVILRFDAFCKLKIFSLKKINWLEVLLIASSTILLACSPINLPIWDLFVRSCFYLWSSERITSLYENKNVMLIIFSIKIFITCNIL